MENSKKYSQEIRKLYRSLKRKYAKVKKVCYDEPLDALVYAAVSENISASAAQSAMKKFGDYFVDLNDMRVSRPEEIAELLGDNADAAKTIAATLITILRDIFDAYNAVSLEKLKKMGKRPAKKTLEKIESTSRFTVNYCMLTSLQGHAIPLTSKMVEYLKSKELVHPQADQQDIEGFLARQIRAENAHEFYALLRRQSEAGGKKSKKQTTSKSKTKKRKRVSKKKSKKG